MKQRILYAATLLFILLFAQCETAIEPPEHTIEIKPATPGFKTAVVNAKQIAKITQSLQAETGLSLLQKDTVSGIVFDTEHIMEVIDTLNNAGYSFRFAYPDTPEHIFYNMVVSADSTGTLQTPYIVKYECDPAHFQDFKNNGYQFRFFRGAVKLHPFSHYFGAGDLFNQTDPECVQYDQYGDPIPCLQTEVGTGGTGGGDPGTGFPTGNTTSGTGNSGGGGTGGYDITLTCSCVGHTENEIEAGICTCPTFILTVNGNAGNANKGLKSTDCPPCSLPGGSAGVNTYPTAVNQLNLILGNELTTEQLDWLENNTDITQELNDFLAEQNYSAEAKEFAVDALELMRLNPDIKLDVSRSFNSPFLIDLSEVMPDDDPATSEIDKETLMHVYNKLLETPTFKNLFTDVFGTADSPYTVKFKLEDNTTYCTNTSANACTKYTIQEINGIPSRVKDNLITIVFDSNKLQDNSFINVARTIIHETIHANLALLEVEDTNATLPYDSMFTVAEFAELLLQRFGGSDHLFMANYYRPVLKQNLQEVLPLLYSQTKIDENENIEYLEDWNWNNFWEYFPWVGLQNTTEFMGQIGANILYNKLFIAYYAESKTFGRDLPN